jgi:Na+-transporting methylmalonyl-CoA/oxaloacetate decarboxylase gamma subunit
MRELKERWEAQTNADATTACALLSLDADLQALQLDDELQERAHRFIVSFGSSYLRFYALSLLSDDALQGRLLVQLAQFTRREDRFDQLLTDVRRTKAEAGQQWSPLIVWAQYCMELSTVAQVLLSVASSEAAVERTFSQQGRTHSKLRNRMHETTVEQEMFVGFNHDALTRAATARPPVLLPGVIELNIEFLQPISDVETETESDEEQPAPSSKKAAKPAASVTAAAAAAAAAAPPLRSQSAINMDNRAFLLKFIADNSDWLTASARWSSARTIALEAAALSDNPGGYSTEQLKRQLKLILEEPSA